MKPVGLNVGNTQLSQETRNILTGNSKGSEIRGRECRDSGRIRVWGVRMLSGAVVGTGASGAE